MGYHWRFIQSWGSRAAGAQREPRTSLPPWNRAVLMTAVRLFSERTNQRGDWALREEEKKKRCQPPNLGALHLAHFWWLTPFFPVTTGQLIGLTCPWKPDDPPLETRIYRRGVALSGRWSVAPRAGYPPAPPAAAPGSASGATGVRTRTVGAPSSSSASAAPTAAKWAVSRCAWSAARSRHCS